MIRKTAKINIMSAALSSLSAWISKFGLSLIFISWISVSSGLHADLSITERSNYQVFFTHYPVALKTAIIEKEGVLYLPIRDVLEEIDASLSYRRRDDTYTLSVDNTSIKIYPNSREYELNTQKKRFPGPAFKYRSRLYLPLNNIFESLSYRIERKNNQFFLSTQDTLPDTPDPPVIAASAPVPVPKIESSPVPAPYQDVLYTLNRGEKLSSFFIPDLSSLPSFKMESQEGKSRIHTFQYIKRQLYAELSPFFTAMGYQVKRDPDRISLSQDGKTYTFVPSTQRLYINSQKHPESESELDYVLVNSPQGVLFPVEAFLKSIGFRPHWEPKTQTMILMTRINSISIIKTEGTDGIEYQLQLDSERPVPVPKPHHLDKKIYWDFPYAEIKQNYFSGKINTEVFDTITYGQHLRKGRLVLGTKETLWSLDANLNNQQSLSTKKQSLAKVLSPAPVSKAPGVKHPKPSGASVLHGRKIAIDPGHGGWDPGAIGINQSREKIYTRDISDRLAALLKKKGAKIYMLREKDQNPSLNTRVKTANRAGADVFLSIHVNSFTSASASGTETFYYKASDKPLATQIHKSLTKSLKLPNKGIKRSRMFVLKHSRMPGVLIEPCFISNPKEYKLLSQAKFRDQMAQAIVDGLEAYFSSHP